MQNVAHEILAESLKTPLIFCSKDDEIGFEQSLK